MRLRASLQIALKALRVNKMRSALTMLGIIIGVAAVITMISVGSGAQARVAEQVRSLGSNIMIILSGTVSSGGVRLGFGSQSTITEDDAAALQREIAGVQAAAPILRGAAQIVYGNANWSTQMLGITPDYLVARDWDVINGRGITKEEAESAAKVALLGQTVALNLFADTDPIGQTIRVRKVPVIVIGILARKGQSLQGQDQDDVVLTPLATARKRIIGSTAANQRSVSAITVKVWDSEQMATAEEDIRALLRQRHRLQPGQDDDFWLRNLSDVLEAQEASSRILTILLAAVASVSLVVGGIGIMNIMLVSVTERTREIGLRMAIGARGKDILAQFLVEAITLSSIGGVAGVIIGVATSFAVGYFAGWQIDLRPEAIILAVSFAGLIGVFFGYYPARKAARLPPIEALRYE